MTTQLMALTSNIFPLERLSVVNVVNKDSDVLMLYDGGAGGCGGVFPILLKEYCLQLWAVEGSSGLNKYRTL
jgi:hypothetical protein